MDVERRARAEKAHGVDWRNDQLRQLVGVKFNKAELGRLLGVSRERVRQLMAKFESQAHHPCGYE